MTTYEPLTKKIIDENGNPMVVCRLYGTEKCRNIHTPNPCAGCPMVAKIMAQLNVFEEVYMEIDDDD